MIYIWNCFTFNKYLDISFKMHDKSLWCRSILTDIIWHLLKRFFYNFYLKGHYLKSGVRNRPSLQVLPEWNIWVGPTHYWCLVRRPWTPAQIKNPRRSWTLPEPKLLSNSNGGFPPLKNQTAKLHNLSRERERDELGGASKERGERSERSRRSSTSGEVQRRRKLLPELRQGPYDPPLEPSPWNPHQDLQVPWPRSQRRPCHTVSFNFLLFQLFLPSWFSLSHSAIFYFLFFNRDNSKLCSCGGDRQIFYWDVATGRVIRKFRGHESEVCSLSLSL